MSGQEVQGTQEWNILDLSVKTSSSTSCSFIRALLSKLAMNRIESRSLRKSWRVFKGIFPGPLGFPLSVPLWFRWEKSSIYILRTTAWSTIVNLWDASCRICTDPVQQCGDNHQNSTCRQKVGWAVAAVFARSQAYVCSFFIPGIPSSHFLPFLN